MPGFGTLFWLVARYKQNAWIKHVFERSRPECERRLNMVLRHKLKNGAELGRMDVRQIDAHGVDKLYDALQKGVRVERRLRTANLCMMRVARAWDAVHRLYPKVVPAHNPFRGVEMEHGDDKARLPPHGGNRAASSPHRCRRTASGFRAAHLFRMAPAPRDVVAGHLSWADYKRSDRPNWVRIEHHKTGERVDMPLSDRHGPLFPELVAYLDSLERFGIPIVLMKPERLRGGAKVVVSRPFLLRTARNRVRKAAEAAKLPEYQTMEACCHGGMTELGDADMTEQNVMALSGYRTPEATRLYQKRTEKQRMLAASKRRIYLVARRRTRGGQNSEWNLLPGTRNE